MGKELAEEDGEVKCINSYVRSRFRDSLVRLYRRAHVYFCTHTHNTHMHMCIPVCTAAHAHIPTMKRQERRITSAESGLIAPSVTALVTLFMKSDKNNVV